jgi:hypothetical protein
MQRTIYASSYVSSLLLLAFAGCASDERYILVNVNARDAVHDVSLLRVTLSNAGSMRTEDIPLGAASFPATFSISPEDRTGELGITIDALDKDGLLAGRGTMQGSIDDTKADVTIEPADFVVNTEVAEDQQIANWYAAGGLQLAAMANGTWITTYNAACPTPCNVFARRFDAKARPVSSALAAGTAGFPVSTKLTTRGYGTPAVAANAMNMLAVWTHQDSVTLTTKSIECRSLDASGAASGPQVQVAPDEFPDLVAATALTNNTFALVWDGRPPTTTTDLIRTAIVRPDCTLVGVVGQANQNATTLFPRNSHLAANPTNILYAWTIDGGAHIRAARLDGVFVNADTELVAKTATERVEFVRVAPLGTGFAAIVRWALSTGSTGPGRLDLYRLSATGAVMGPPILVSSRSGSDFASSESFGVAAGRKGELLVVWHACLDRGDGSGCGVFGRLIGPTGEPAGAEFPIPTTTNEDQTRPSAAALPDGAFAVAWTDRSLGAPDTSGSSVRARIVYPATAGGATLSP